MISVINSDIKPVYQSCLQNPRIVGVMAKDRFFKLSHDKWVKSVYPYLVDYEHFILKFQYRQPIHLAVVVLDSGVCYVGERRFGHTEQYNRKRGFETALGRALKRAVREPTEYDFMVDNELSGRELREVCIDKLGIRGNYNSR